MSATMVGWRQKKKKKKILAEMKCPKDVPQKTNFGPKYKLFKISYLEFFLWKYYFGHTQFLYSSTRSSGHDQSFFLFQIFEQKVSKPTKISEKDHSFYNKVLLKNTYSFYEPQLTWHWKRYVPATQPKTSLTLQIFQQTCFSFVPEKHFHCTISWKANVCIFVYISVRKCLFQRRSKILSGGEWGWGGVWVGVVVVM